MKLLFDMNLTPKLIAMLNSRNLEAVHWREIGKIDAFDSDIMNYALDGVVFSFEGKNNST